MRTYQRLLLSAAFCCPWAAPALALDLHAVGSFSAAGLFAAWKKAYEAREPGVKLDYGPRRGRDGIEQWLGRGADLLVVPLPLEEADERRTLGNRLYLPVGLTATVITYNLPAVPAGLRLTPQALSDIFSGRIKRWDDPALREMNPGFLLPALDITVLHRDEESSLDDLFPAFLKGTDGAWATDGSGGQKLKWPVGRTVHGDEETLRELRRTAGAIAAVDLPFAALSGLPAARLQNGTGRFTAPTPETLTAAVADLADLPDDLKVSVSRPRDPQAYPLTSFLWLLARPQAPKGTRDFGKPTALADFLGWIAEEGQSVEERAGGVPLPKRFLGKLAAQAQMIQTGPLPAPAAATPGESPLPAASPADKTSVPSGKN